MFITASDLVRLQSKRNTCHFPQRPIIVNSESVLSVDYIVVYALVVVYMQHWLRMACRSMSISDRTMAASRMTRTQRAICSGELSSTFTVRLRHLDTTRTSSFVHGHASHTQPANGNTMKTIRLPLARVGIVGGGGFNPLPQFTPADAHF